MARFRPGGLGGGVGGFAAGDNFLFCFPLLFGVLKQASISQSPPRLLGRSPCVTRPPCRCRKLWGTFFLAPPTPLRATSDSTLPIQLGPPRSLTPPGQDPPSINNVPSRTAAPHPGCSFLPPPPRALFPHGRTVYPYCHCHCKVSPSHSLERYPLSFPRLEGSELLRSLLSSVWG